MTTDFRKTLLISSYAPPSLAGAPQIMYRLISSLTPESYTILTSFYNIDNISAKIGTWLPGDYVFYDNPIATKAVRQQHETKPEERIIGPAVQLKSWLRKTILFPNWIHIPLSAAIRMDLVARLKRLIKRNRLIKILLGAPLILGQIPLIIYQGCRVVKDRNIELLIGFSDYGPAMVGTYYIHKATGVPFDIYLFDIYKGNLLPLSGNLLAMIYEPRLLTQANKIIVNNKETKEFYRRRYGDQVADKIVIVYNATDPAPYLALQTPISPHQPPYTILFTGNVYWAQINSIKNLIEAIDGMHDLDIRFKLYSPIPPEYLRSIGINSPKIDFSVAPGSEMPTIQSQADILFLPLAWHTNCPDIINTATPGKLTDYLIAGRPMLIHAPASSHLVKYARENDFAVIVDEENIPALQTTIRRLLSDGDLARRLVNNAQRTFFANHDIRINTELFQSLLTK